MRTITSAAMAAVMAFALPTLAAAQATRSAQTMQGMPNVEAQGPTGGAAGRGIAGTQGAVIGTQTPAAAAPGRQRPPRSEKAIGPDLMAYLFAPLGVIVEPITDGLHQFDAAIAPINEALLPITGPSGPALVSPPGEPLAGEVPATVGTVPKK